MIAGVGDLARLGPGMVKEFGTLGNIGTKTGQLDAKTYELIAVAVGIALRCDGRITVHTEAACWLGATRAEVAEVLGLAVSGNAGVPAFYVTPTLDAFAASAESELSSAGIGS